MKTYRGYDIFNHDPNSMGLKYYAYGKNGKLRADSMAGMQRLIRDDIYRS